MGKHDKTTADSYLEARLQELESRLAFAEENNKKLQDEIAKYSKLLAKHDDEAMRIIKAKDQRITKLEATIVRLAVQ